MEACDEILGHEFDKRLDSFAPYAINSLFYWRILQKTVLYYGLKLHTKNPRVEKVV
jgi:hypothetical protein